MIHFLQRHFRWFATGLFTLFLMIFASVSYIKIKVYVEQEAREKQLLIMNNLKTTIESWMKPSMRLVTQLGEELSWRKTFEKEEIVPLLAHAKKAIGSVQVYMGLEDGRMMYDTGKELDPKWYNPKERSWYQDGLQSDTTVVSMPFVGFASNQLTLTVMTPIVVNEEKKGVVAASFYINNLYRQLKTVGFEYGYAYIVNHEGVVVLHPDKSMQSIDLKTAKPSKKEFLRAMNEKNEGFFEYNNGTEEELLSYSRLQNGWFTVVVFKKALVMAFINKILIFFIMMGILMSLLYFAILDKIHHLWVHSKE